MKRPNNLKLQAAESEVDVKSKTLANINIVPTLSLDDVIELERHEQAMVDIQSLLNLLCGLTVPNLVLSFFLASSRVLMFAGQ